MNWSYLAGIIDGEGSIVIRQTLERKAVWISVVNTNRTLLESIQPFIGDGNVYADNRHHPGWQPAYSYILKKHHVVKTVLLNVLGDLIVKRTKAMAAVDFIDSQQWAGKKEINMAHLYKLRSCGFSLRQIECMEGFPSRATLSKALRGLR